jgi:hypothetical protein
MDRGWTEMRVRGPGGKKGRPAPKEDPPGPRATLDQDSRGPWSGNLRVYRWRLLS